MNDNPMTKSILICLVLLLGGCARSKVVYRIPPDKQEAAAKMMTELARTGVGPFRSLNDIREQVEHIYGEPVIIKP